MPDALNPPFTYPRHTVPAATRLGAGMLYCQHVRLPWAEHDGWALRRCPASRHPPATTQKSPASDGGAKWENKKEERLGTGSPGR